MHTTNTARLATFEGRNDVFPVSIESLAAAGFCWTPFTSCPATVRCEDCELVLKDWIDQGDPIDAHKHARPDCQFLQSFGVNKVAQTDEKAQNPNDDSSGCLIDITFVDSQPHNEAPAIYISDTCRELMEIFPAPPPRKQMPSVDDIVGGFTNRDRKPRPNDNPGSSYATNRVLPQDLKTCRHCGAHFQERDMLFQHVYTNCGQNPERCPNPFPCRVCRDSFGTKQDLKVHLKLKHDISLWF